MIVEIVLPVRDVEVMDRLDHGLIAVVLGQVQIIAIPLLTGVGEVSIVFEHHQVGVIAGLGGTLVVAGAVGDADTVFHLVQVAVRQAIFVQKIPTLLIDGQVEAPQVAIVLSCAWLRCFIDHSELKVIGRWGGDTGQVE